MTETLFWTYLCAVAEMRRLQLGDWVNYSVEELRKLNVAEREVDELTRLHMLPAVPAPDSHNGGTTS